MEWLDGVLVLPGPTVLRVALALLYQSGLERSSTVRFTRKLMDRFHVDRQSASRSLKRMQAAGVLRVHHKPGRCREIEILMRNVDRSIDSING